MVDGCFVGEGSLGGNLAIFRKCWVVIQSKLAGKSLVCLGAVIALQSGARVCRELILRV